MREKFAISDSKKIFLLFLGVSIALMLSFLLLIMKSESTTDKSYEVYDIPEISIQNQVIRFIELTNNLTLDRVLTNQSIIKTYHLLTDKTAARFSSLTKTYHYFDKFGENTREVYITKNPTKVANDTYTLQYKVLTREISGILLSNINYEATIEAKVLHPSVSDIKDNPLGIYITDFNIKKINEKEEL